MIRFSFIHIDTDESAISIPEPDIVVSDEPAVGLGKEATEEEEPAPPVDVLMCKKRFIDLLYLDMYMYALTETGLPLILFDFAAAADVQREEEEEGQGAESAEGPEGPGSLSSGEEMLR